MVAFASFKSAEPNGPMTLFASDDRKAAAAAAASRFGCRCIHRCKEFPAKISKPRHACRFHLVLKYFPKSSSILLKSPEQTFDSDTRSSLVYRIDAID